MNRILIAAALLGLALTLLPPVLLFAGVMEDLPTAKNVMFAGMILWFACATPWLAFRKLQPADLEVEI